MPLLFDPRLLAAASAALLLSSGSAVTPPQPIVFNASESAAAGDVVFVQGYNFGNNPVVTLQGGPGTASRPLRIVNRVADWLAVQLPPTAGSALDPAGDERWRGERARQTQCGTGLSP